MDQALDPGEPSAEPPPPPRRLRAPDGGAVLEALTQTSSRDEVVRLALRGLRLVARRLAVFAVRRDGFLGWACNVSFGDPDAFRELLILQELPSILATAAAASMYLGPIPQTPPHEGLLRIMERSSSDVAAISVRVGGRAAMILVADDLEDTLMGTRWMEELARAIGEALSRLLAVKGY
jgi:class 3 adenylate cyclase